MSIFICLRVDSAAVWRSHRGQYHHHNTSGNGCLWRWVCAHSVGTCLCCSVHVQQWQMVVKAQIVRYIEDYIAGRFLGPLLRWPISTQTTFWSYRAACDCFIIIYCHDPATSHHTLQEIRPPLFRSWAEWNGGGGAHWERFMWLFQLIDMWAKAINSGCVPHEVTSTGWLVQYDTISVK